jgi:hypothetical protein
MLMSPARAPLDANVAVAARAKARRRAPAIRPAIVDEQDQSTMSFRAGSAKKSEPVD